MQQFLQPIAEQYCDFLPPNTVQDWEFAPASNLLKLGKVATHAASKFRLRPNRR
jgi:hypothetical protein